MGQKHSHRRETKECGGKGGMKREEEGEKGTLHTHEHTFVTWTDLVPCTNVTSPAVNWDLVNRLDPHNNPYIDYQGVIKQQRLPSLFSNPPVPNPSVFAGGLFTEVSEDEPRRVYFEASNPAKPCMRVAEQLKDEDTVTALYPWDSVNFVYHEMGPESYMFYIYTPANLGGYGLAMDDEEVYFKPTPEELKLFEIRPLDQEKAHIKVVNSDIGLYVDMEDGGKVKATTDQQRWNEFWITGFAPQI